MRHHALVLGFWVVVGCSPIVLEDSGDSGTGGVGGSAPATAGNAGTGLEIPEIAGSGALPDPNAGASAGGATGSAGTGTGVGIESAGGTPGEGEGGAGGENVDLELGAGDLTMLVVFDKSGSMADGWDQRSKWQVANEAFMKAIDGVLDNLTIGTIFFPIPGDCAVEALNSGAQMDFRSGRAFASAWQESAASRVPEGATPLELALRTADTAVDAALELGLLEDRFRVVLVTDGEPTCEDDPAAMVALAAKWYALGVETWVMGLPGSAGATELLDAIAEAGGTEKHQSLGTPDELDHGLYEAAR
jgi:hypothetical protein